MHMVIQGVRNIARSKVRTLTVVVFQQMRRPMCQEMNDRAALEELMRERMAVMGIVPGRA